MKKIIAIICALSLIFGMIFSNALLASADTYTKVYVTHFLNQAGDGEYTVNSTDAAFPDWVQDKNDYFVPAEDPSNFGLSLGLKFNQPDKDASAQLFTSSKTYAEAAGYLIKIKTDSAENFLLPLYLLCDNGKGMKQVYQWGYTEWYVLGKGDTAWTAKTVENYGVTFDAGFDGYLYIPFNVVKNNGVWNWKDTYKICGIEAFGKGTAREIYMSLPLFVDRATLGANNLPTADKIIIGTTENTYFKVEQNQGGGSGSGNGDGSGSGDGQGSGTGSGEGSGSGTGTGSGDGTGTGTGSGSGTGSTDESVKLPEYTGETIDYGKKITKIKDMALAGPLAIGQAINTETIMDLAEQKTISAIKNPNPMSAYPLIKSEGRMAEYSGAKSCVYSIFSDPKKSTGVEGLVLYLKLPEDSGDTTIEVKYNFYAGGNLAKARSAYQYSGKCWLMNKGESSWKEAEIFSYQLDLPAGFDGFILMDSKLWSCEGQEKLTPEDALKQVNIYIPGWTGGTIYASIPWIVTSMGDRTSSVYLGDETKCARSLFDGSVVKADELKQTESEIKVGDTFDILPEGTTDKEIKEPASSDYTSNGVKLKWDAFDGAASYRVELYSKSFTMDGLSYKLENIQNSTTTSATVTGMTEGMTYSVIVRAFDANGKPLGIYNSIQVVNSSDSGDDFFGNIGGGSDDDDDFDFGFNGFDDEDEEQQDFLGSDSGDTSSNNSSENTGSDESENSSGVELGDEEYEDEEYEDEYDEEYEEEYDEEAEDEEIVFEGSVPSTGESNMIYIALAIFVVSISFVVFCIYRKHTEK